MERLGLELAQRIVEAAKKKAEELEIKEDIAVVDAGGNLKAFVRMDGAWLGSIDIAVAATLLLASGAATLNQVMERRYDALMRRTMRRPIAAGRVSAARAFVFGIVLALGGSVWLFAGVNAIAGFLGLFACPSSTGAKEVVPSALSPLTGYAYIPAHNTCMNYQPLLANYISGAAFLGASVKMYKGPGGWQGELLAWDIKNQKPVWSIKDPNFPVYSGVLATAGNVVFYGTLEGWFRAVDARTGDILWQYKMPSGIIGDPMTYIGPDGKQYVAIYSGIGGWMGAAAFPTISMTDPYAALGIVGAMSGIKETSPPGSNIYIFGL